MKLSKETKEKTSNYIQKLKEQIKSDTGLEISGKILSPLRRYYESKLHEIERSNILMSLEIQAHELGYTLIKKENN